MDFHPIEANLRQSFRALAETRDCSSVVELPGVSIASLGVRFQMFNAAFLSAPVSTQAELEQRLGLSRCWFDTRDLPWAIWICEDWLDHSIRRKLTRTCETFRLRLSTELPGMYANRMEPARRALPAIEVRPANDAPQLADFCAIGSSCFHVPMTWFGEVFDARMHERQRFKCWVAYERGRPVATAATVTGDGVIGLYNVATAPEHRRRGIGEAITRDVIAEVRRQTGFETVILQATSQGFPLYKKMGFEETTRILVYNS